MAKKSEETTKKNPQGPQVPTGYAEQTDSVDGVWKREYGPIHFIPEGVRLFDSSVEPMKASIFVVGTLVDAVKLDRKEGDAVITFEGKPGQSVGVWASAGMRGLKKQGGVATYMYEDGAIETGKPNPMRVFRCMSAGKGVTLPVLHDGRKESKNWPTFLDGKEAATEAFDPAEDFDRE